MANKKDKLDEIFASKLAKNEIEPSAKAWDKLSLAMQQKNLGQNKNRKFVWWFLILSGLLGSAGIANVMYFNPSKNEKNVNQTIKINKNILENQINENQTKNEKNNISSNINENLNEIQKNENNKINNQNIPNQKEDIFKSKNDVVSKENKKENITNENINAKKIKSTEKSKDNIVENSKSKNDINTSKNNENKTIEPKKEEKIDDIEELKIKVSVKINKNTPKSAEAQASGQEISERPKGLRRIFKNDSLKSKVKDIFKRKNTN